MPSDSILDTNNIALSIRQLLKAFHVPTPSGGNFTHANAKSLITAPLKQLLEQNLPAYNFVYEKRPSPDLRDSFDLYGSASGCPDIVVEIDTHRCDQITKKLVSRLALTAKVPLIYIAVLYPNAHKAKEAEKAETKKYLDYIETLFSMLQAEQKRFLYHLLY